MFYLSLKSPNNLTLPKISKAQKSDKRKDSFFQWVFVHSVSHKVLNSDRIFMENWNDQLTFGGTAGILSWYYIRLLCHIQRRIINAFPAKKTRKDNTKFAVVVG